jgi:hypothetical protein
MLKQGSEVGTIEAYDVPGNESSARRRNNVTRKLPTVASLRGYSKKLVSNLREMIPSTG